MESDVQQFAQVMTIIVVSIASLVAIGLGARVLWRLGSPRKTAIGAPHDEERQERLEAAVDAIAIEVERISEAQRFMVGLLSESLPARRAAGELMAPRSITPH
ncbi:MAG: hypothetical protein JWN79_3285 [Gemmatimonadetes bacterium]|nr:hypothetical protein [Gemmatimonadota bacterium]